MSMAGRFAGGGFPGLLASPSPLFAPCSAGIKFFPQGRDYLGANIYMLKGIPDQPTTDNFPGVPIDLSLANWCAEP